MTHDATNWATVWEAVRARQEALGWTDVELYNRCGISQKVYADGRLRGRPLKRHDKIAGLEYGLGWRRGSVDAILVGGEPVVENVRVLHDISPTPTVEHPPDTVAASHFDERLERLERVQAEILRELIAGRERRERQEQEMMGGDTNASESGGRGPRNGGKADSDPGGTGGRRDRREDQVPAKDRGVQPQPDRR